MIHEDPLCDECGKPELLIYTKKLIYKKNKRSRADWLCIECLSKQANQQANHQEKGETK